MKTFDPPLARRSLLALCLAIIVAAAWFAPIDTPANTRVDAGLKRALISFAGARALDALISVAQGTEVAVQPAGVGVVLSPGQILDPVNDLVEQFADLMLAASVAFATQKILLGIGAHWSVSLALTASALAWALWRERTGNVPGGLSRLLTVLLMARFALPLAVIGSDTLFERFMAADYRVSQQTIDAASGQLDAHAAPSVGASSGWLERFKDWAAQPGEIKARYTELRNAAEQLIERIVKLIVVFVLQTIVLPTLLLWTLWGVLRRLLEAPPSGAH
jgi:hypothetical protein